MQSLEEQEEQQRSEERWGDVVEFRCFRGVVADLEEEPKPEEEPKGGDKPLLLCGELKPLLQ